MTDHAIARADHRPVLDFQAEFTQDGTLVHHAHEVASILAVMMFPNMPFALNQIHDEDAQFGLWLVPIPVLVAAEVNAGVDFGWTEVLPYDFGEGESIVSILVPSR